MLNLEDLMWEIFYKVLILLLINKICISAGGGRKSSTEEGVRRASSVSDEGGFNEPSPDVAALRPAERARSDPDTLSVLQQVQTQQQKFFYIS